MTATAPPTLDGVLRALADQLDSWRAGNLTSKDAAALVQRASRHLR